MTLSPDPPSSAGVWRGVVRLAVTSGALAAAAAAVALGLCVAFVGASAEDIGAALFTAGLLLLAAGTVSSLGEGAFRMSFQARYPGHHAEGLEYMRKLAPRDIAETNRNLRLLWVCTVAAAPLLGAGILLLRIGGD